MADERNVVGGAGRDLYAVLGVSASATTVEIRSAFRTLAAQFHPDRNPEDRGAATRFKRINAAWQVLQDPQKREAYDSLTQQIDGDERDEPHRTSPPSPAPSAKKPKARAAAPPAQPSSPPIEHERELARDPSIVVTTWRVMVAGSATYDVARIRGVQYVHQGRDMAWLVFGSLTGILGLCFVVMENGRGSAVGVLLGGAALVRFVSQRPRYTVRLNYDGQLVDVATSPNATWTRDVVRAIEQASSESLPRGIQATSFSVTGGVAGYLAGLVAVVITLIVGFGAGSPERVATTSDRHTVALAEPAGASATAPAVQTSPPVPVLPSRWMDVSADDIAVSMPEAPASSTHVETIAGHQATIHGWEVKRGRSIFSIQVVDFANVESWNAAAAVDGSVTKALEGARAEEGVVSLIVQNDERLTMASMPGRKVLARVSGKSVRRPSRTECSACRASRETT